MIRHPEASGAILRVFVSSVVNDYEAYRDAARRGIEAAGATPIMVNEDFPSQGTSSRNACLDGVESSDCLISIIGARGGWKAPSGRLVVEEEVEHARLHNIPVLVFLQDIAREADADRLARGLSDYVGGMFRTTFHTPAELQEQVELAIRPRVHTMKTRNVEGRDLTSYLAPERHASGVATMLRFVLAPERDEEVLGPVRIASEDLKQRLLELGHARPVPIFSYSQGTAAEIKAGALSVEQGNANSRHGREKYVRLELTERGVLFLEGNVTGRSADSIVDTMRDSFVINIETVEEVLATFFRFSAVLYEEIDPHRRHERFYYNVGLRGLGHRSLERGRQPKDSYRMGMHKSDSIAAFATSRILSRATLASDGQDELQRVITLLERLAREE